MAVPFKSLRYPFKKKITMGLLVSRFIGRKSEQTSFPELDPEGGAIMSQAQKIELSDVKFERPMEFIPALTYDQGSSHGDGEMRSTGKNTDFSLTGKLGLTSNLTLDATYNPDFSQVETDAGQIDVNLRYSIYYSEKRPFFLEGMENFNFATAMEANTVGAIVYTRTIVDPLLGVKLTGKIGSQNVLSGIFALDEYPRRPGGRRRRPRPGRAQCLVLHPALQAADEPGQLCRRLFHRPQLRRRQQQRRRRRRPLAAEQHQLFGIQLFQVLQPRRGSRARTTRGTPWACATTSATAAGTSTWAFST